MKKSTSLLAVALAVFALPAWAQDGAIATLQAQTGNVTISTGGEFSTAETGQRLQAGNRLMLTEGSSASLLYDNECTLSFSQPGVFAVPADCKPKGAAATGNGNNAAVIGGIAAGAAAIALAAGGGDDGDGDLTATPQTPVPPPPVSP